MSDNNAINGEQALDKTMTLLKKAKTVFPNLKIFAYIIAFLSAGGGTVFVWVWDKSQEHIVKVATPHIIHYADSIAVAKMDAVLDSIERDRLLNKSFEYKVAKIMDVPKDSLDIYIGRWFNREKYVFHVGLFKDIKKDKVLYRHTNGEIYRAVYNARDDIYKYFDDNGKWRNVK